MELIVTEKNNAARRIADILSEGGASTDTSAGVNVYEWGGRRCIGLSGHVVGVDFPPEYSDWRDVEPAELVHADVVKEPTQEDIVNALQRLAREADSVIIATDYDREGELIGKEAYELVRAVNEDVPVNRVRFSSITDNEVRSAFAEPDEIDFDLAAAGEARQTIDLMWGAALTRFLSLSARQMGNDFISVGRVQTPTLKLIVDKEREIEAFEPDDYWELFADLTKDQTEFEAQYFYEGEDGNEAERVWDEADAEAAFETLRDASEAIVQSVSSRTRTDDPPAPFNTTQFIRAAGSLGYSAGRAMSIAEDLYTAGYITYPRTDNTVYPDDLDERELLEAFENTVFGDDASSLLERDALAPTEGDEETTDHPPIHPTSDFPDRNRLSEDEWEVYELVVRRFFATLAPSAVWEHLRVVSDVPAAPAGDSQTASGQSDGERLKANGKRLVEEGYHAVYPYFNTSENHVPAVEEGEALALADARMEAKQTQPPRRYGQSRLIETMEDLGVGTKSTRHNTIEKLYDRGYIEDDPPRPTTLAKAVVEAAEEYADLVVSEEMTSELEADMTAIADGEKSLDEVTDESRQILDRVFDELAASREEIGEHLRASLKADKTLGECPECGDTLLVRSSRTGSYFVGCDGYPECRFTLPLPSTGEPLVLEAACEEHGLNEVKMLAGRNTFVHGCPLCAAEKADESEDRVIGACPDCGEGAAPEGQRDDGGDSEARSVRKSQRDSPSPSEPRSGSEDASDRSSGRRPREEAAEAKGGELAIKQLQTGSRLVGCTRYPDCEYSLPLPRRGDIEVTETYCDEHDLPELVVYDGEDDDDPWELGCPICNYEEYQERQRQKGLEVLDGIGPKTAEKLEDAGIEDVGDLTEAEPETVAEEVAGVSEDSVREWQAKAD